MRWYASRYGETVGPVEGAEVIDWLQKSGTLEGVFLRDEAASEWIAVDKSPFAGISMPIRSTPAAVAIPQAPTKQHSTTTAMFVGVTGVVALLILFGWILDSNRRQAAIAAAPDNAPPPPNRPEPEAPSQPAVVAAPYLSEVDSDWAAFDALSPQQRTKPQLQTHLTSQAGIVDRTPETIRPLVASHSLMLARQHFSAWSSVGASAGGENATDLIPSSDKAKCALWGSMWTGDVDTLKSIMSLGFVRIVCPSKTWILKDEASVCYLWSVDPDDNGAKGAAIVWTSLELLQKAQIVGRRTDDDGPLALMALGAMGVT